MVFLLLADASMDVQTLFFHLKLHRGEVEAIRAVMQNFHCSERREWKGNFHNLCVKTSTRKLIFIYTSILKKIWRDYYSSKILFLGSNYLIFRSHIMETSRNYKRIYSIRTLGDGYSLKLMWMEFFKNIHIALIYSNDLNLKRKL